MTTNVAEFSVKYELDKYNLFENDSWIVSLRPQQKTPFSMLLSLKKDKFQLRDLDAQETNELQECFTFIEKLCYDTLGADKLNYLCLMMIDSIIHYHVFPRFKNELVLNHLRLKDVYFPKPVELLDDHSIDIDPIFNYLKSI